MSDNGGAQSQDNIYNLLATKEIEDMLRFAVFSEGDLDMEYVDRLLAELKRREAANADISPEDALKEFKEEYSGKESPYLSCAYRPLRQIYHANRPERSRRKYSLARTAMVATIVVVIMLGSMVVAQAAGIDVFGAIARWTDDIFTFSNNVDNPSQQPHPKSGGSSYQTLYEALEAYNLADKVMPIWIPEGFEQCELEVSERLSGVQFFASYENGDAFFSIRINRTDSPSSVHEKANAEVKLISLDGVDYYLMKNTDTRKAVWYTEGFECSIQGDLSEETLRKMIETIRD